MLYLYCDVPVLCCTCIVFDFVLYPVLYFIVLFSVVLYSITNPRGEGKSHWEKGKHEKSKSPGWRVRDDGTVGAGKREKSNTRKVKRGER